jgi:hypothetical protein
MDSNTTYKIGLFTILVIGFIAVGLSMNHSEVNITKAEESYLESLQKRDSLQNVIDSLQTELNTLENGFDARETRYEDVIGEYEIGLSYLKDYHPLAYRDFNRIIGMRERYTRELEKENKERLSKYKKDL